jgi:hypothetical protein
LNICEYKCSSGDEQFIYICTCTRSLLRAYFSKLRFWKSPYDFHNGTVRIRFSQWYSTIFEKSNPRTHRPAHRPTHPQPLEHLGKVPGQRHRMARPGIVLLRKTKRIKRSDHKAKRKRDQAEAPEQAATVAELESDDAEGSYYWCTKKRKSADGDACQQSAPRRPRWTPEQTPWSHQTPDQTPRADQAAMGTTPHHHLVDHILDSLQRSTYRFGGILALTRPALNSLFSGDHASGGLDVALGVLSSKNEVHFGVGAGGCQIVVLGPILEVAKRESKVTCHLRQVRFLGFVGSGSAIHTGKQTGDKRQSPGGKQHAESESKNSSSNVKPTPWVTSAKTKQLGTTSVATTIEEVEDGTAPRPDLRLPQELSQPITGTQSTEAQQHSEIIWQTCQKPHCKLKGKCGNQRQPSLVGL